MLDKSTFKFLSDLGKNNNKEWFEANRKRYDAAKLNFLSFFDPIYYGVAEFDDNVSRNIENSKKIFRINRDMRFSKDKTPYKTNFGGVIAPKEMQGGMAGYYLHIEPDNNSGLGGGVYRPDPKTLHKVRSYIAEHADQFLDIIGDADFRRHFKDLSESEVSKKALPEFDVTNPAYEYLRMKSFTVWKVLPEDELTEAGVEKKIVKSFKVMQPFLDFLNKALAQ